MGGAGVATWHGSGWSVVATFPGVPSPALWSLEKAGPCSVWGSGRLFQGQILPLTVRLDPGGISTFCPSPQDGGTDATIGWLGSSSIAAHDLILTAAAAPPRKAGRFFLGDQQTSMPFGNGVRCVAGHLIRLPLVQTSSAGTASQAFTYPGSVAPGSLRYFQFCFRDPGTGGAGFGITNALEVQFTP